MGSKRFAGRDTELRAMVADMGRWPTRSVRFRVTALATVIVALVLIVLAVTVVVVQRQALTAALDEGLRLRADDLGTLVAAEIPETLSGTDDDAAAQLTTLEGVIVVSSPNLATAAPIGPIPGSHEVVSEGWLDGPDDSFRVLSRIVGSPEGSMVLHVATATDEISDPVGVLRTSMLIGIPLAMVVLAFTVWGTVGRALRPVSEIRLEADDISDSDLSRRVTVPLSDDEIERLAITMNRMLERIERGVGRLQQFVADASHELRSPLTRMRSELEVDRQAPLHADPAATQASVLEEVIAMETLVDDLLFLTRSDAGRHDAAFEPVDLDDIVLAEAERLRSETRVAVDASSVSAGQVIGDRGQLRRLLSNLATNAARYATHSVSFDLKEVDAMVVVGIGDDGPGIPITDRERVFERFTRTDEGRSRDEGGSGLGLAIAKDIVERHSGTIRVDPGYRNGARFEVRLPLARLPSVVGEERVEQRTHD